MHILVWKHNDYKKNNRQQYLGKENAQVAGEVRDWVGIN